MRNSRDVSLDVEQNNEKKITFHVTQDNFFTLHILTIHSCFKS